MRRLPFTIPHAPPGPLPLGGVARTVVWALLLGLSLAAPRLAQADQVLLFPPGGGGDEELRDHVEEALADALISLEHQPMNVSAELADSPPTTGNEMRAVAEMERCQWIVVPTVSGTRARYRLELQVGQAADGRLEHIEVSMLGDGEGARLRDVLTAMLRQEGIGDDAVRLTEEPDDAATRAAEAAEAERLRQEAEEAEREAEEEREREEAAREEFLARERERAAAVEAERQATWEGREQYGQRSTPWMISAGLDLRPIVATPAGGSGGMLWGLSGTVGRTFEGLDGFELRATIGGFGGSASGLTLSGGGAYLHSFFQNVPLFIGLALEVGLFQQLTGNKSASFMLRVAPTISWRFTGDVSLEAAVLEVQYMSIGAATLGGSLKLAYRF
ncbi:MAG: hypothetical protein DRJ42_04265 [Deltaproteobacteria bacterium]|nr:MAG: hypothetical protein DRJ42_04265 [Deltaproteobacteria bacterium]